MPCLYSWELQQAMSYVQQTLRICSDLHEQNSVSKACHVLPSFVFGISQKPGKQAVTSFSALQQGMMPLQF